ncbi:MAG: heterocyst differentiation related protein [Aulosira sp. ZfuVER01]|nr:heterocyst differentiation related protein [Aulosira sp. ZfuVER01]MDZ7996649.1 heterocyst differentiation related protein [Aulosira sp. DedVER01a]MDZ8056411.1 heterocyst differentiation related protein [Aulosira sp. ZfuCHP01]
MSESMAFIGGVAVAGLAALLLLKGAGNSMQPNFAVTPQMPAVVQQPQMMPPQYPYQQPLYPNNQPPTAPNTERLADIESVKSELARLKTDNEQLRAQNQQLQWQFQSYNQQQQQMFAQQNNQKAALQPQTPWWSSPIVWAVGGMTLTIGGGVVVAGVLALFSPKQRTTRTVQVIHPYQGPTQPLVPIRRTELLPPRMETRRVEAPEYDEMH